MMYKAKAAVCSDIHTKHSKQSERHVQFLNVKPWWYVKNPLGFKRLNPIRHLLPLVGAHHIVHVSRIRVKQWYCYLLYREMPVYCLGLEIGYLAEIFRGC